MNQTVSRPRALLIHRGELADLRPLLASLEVDVFERRDELRPEEARQRWDLVIATATLVPHLTPPTGTRRPTCIAVLQEATRTLVARLRLSDADLVVRRPFHPSVLRLLVVRALYRGPERRRSPRVPIGADVRLEAGLRRHPALLVDLSMEGCRLETTAAIRRGDRATLLLPRNITGGRRLALRCEGVRALGRGQTTLRFLSLSSRKDARLAAVLERHQAGPAALEAVPEPPVPDEEGIERRRWPRRAFPRRVIALGDEAARVLMGRDLSLGGMRVEPDASLRVGERLRLAIHGGCQGTPAVLEADVVRDEGERGYVLCFQEVGERERAYLAGLLSESSSLADAQAPAQEAHLVVSELLP